ncbi:unnamed protein product [Psylliodes chrysocephalus]|uniref:Peptidase S1 domain-containing protein n=1 Tax=Psylliodes chrysocephalus TaxID=3402493 RepID=A0A9P0CAK0_9CUCU|nr:unnamed protein product [Psylliodes chrysocephala]
MLSAKVIFLATVALCYGAPNAKLSNKRLSIAGGTDTTIEEYPFVASVQWCDSVCKHVSGGVIVNENWVLTSAIYATNAEQVVVGYSNLQGEDNVAVEVADAYVYPYYNPGLAPYDIALLQLAEALTFNDKVQPAKLPTQGQKFDGTAVVVGYGTTNQLQVSPNLTLIPYDECTAAVLKIFPESCPLDPDSNMCTLNEKSNNCHGDVGGPLSQDGTVIGTATFYVDPCGYNGAPNIFTQVSSFADWINQTITKYSQIL